MLPLVLYEPSVVNKNEWAPAPPYFLVRVFQPYLMLIKALFDSNICNLQDMSVLWSMFYRAGKTNLFMNFGFWVVLPSKAKSKKCMEKTEWNKKYNKARIGKVSKHRCTCEVKGLREFWCRYQHHSVHQADCDWIFIKNGMASPAFFNGLVDIVIFNGKGSLV